MSELNTIPYGELQGHLCLRVHVPPNADPDYIIEAYLNARAPGVRVIWLESNAWSSPNLSSAIAKFASDLRTSEVTLWCLREAEATEWPVDPLWTCLNINSLVAAKITSSNVEELFMRLPYLPKPSELVCTSVNAANLSPFVLDEMMTNLDPDRYGWVYCQDTSLREVALRAVSKAVDWCVR